MFHSINSSIQLKLRSRIPLKVILTFIGKMFERLIKRTIGCVW